MAVSLKKEFYFCGFFNRQLNIQTEKYKDSLHSITILIFFIQEEDISSKTVKVKRCAKHYACAKLHVKNVM